MTPRTRDWRRAKARALDSRPQSGRSAEAVGEKRWNQIYFRSNKLKRAQQLGRLWPHRHWEQAMAEARPLRILFICSMNRWRSPTAEAVYAKDTSVAVRSAGTSRNAKKPVAYDDIRWADLVLVMESKHEAQLRARFRGEFRHKPIHVLGIPDDYKFMDQALVELVTQRAGPLILSLSGD